MLIIEFLKYKDGKAAVKELEKTIKCIETKTRTIHTTVFLIIMHGSESWTVKKADNRKKMICSK